MDASRSCTRLWWAKSINRYISLSHTLHWSRSKCFARSARLVLLLSVGAAKHARVLHAKDGVLRTIHGHAPCNKLVHETTQTRRIKRRALLTNVACPCHSWVCMLAVGHGNALVHGHFFWHIASPRMTCWGSFLAYGTEGLQELLGQRGEPIVPHRSALRQALYFLVRAGQLFLPVLSCPDHCSARLPQF